MIVSGEPAWKEISESQKIERLREVAKDLQRQVNTIGEMVEALSRHQHIDKTIVQPVDRPGEFYSPFYQSKREREGYL